jgi:biopolymer transport protein ExbB/TolQ
MKFNNKLNRSKLGALTLCLGTALGMSVYVGSSSPFIGLMLGTITIGVYVMIVTGKWKAKTHNKKINQD